MCRADGITFGELLRAAARSLRRSERPPRRPAIQWVPDRVLLDAGVEPWMELPMWAPDIPELAAIWQVSGDRAVRTGIRYRPLADTVRDTWLWLRREAAATGRAVTEFERAPGIGLDPAKEQAILSGL